MLHEIVEAQEELRKTDSLEVALRGVDEAHQCCTWIAESDRISPDGFPVDIWEVKVHIFPLEEQDLESLGQQVGNDCSVLTGWEWHLIEDTIEVKESCIGTYAEITLTPALNI
ncbi:MAG: hypothetical protein HOC20_01465 [Chloroflexi bacterium]|nr:hypothetical protein [Chloroflexota bacterium]